MDITILGAGTVGSSIAETLCRREVSVTLVDRDPAKLASAGERLDVRTLVGEAANSATLFRAGILSSDLCLAVTREDETNLVAASIAKAMGCRRSVARIHDAFFRDYSTFDYQNHFGVDRLLSLEQLTALELAKALRAPGLYAVENFARGGVQIQEVAVDRDSKTCGVAVKDLGLPPGVLIGLIDRAEGGKGFIPRATDAAHADDHVTLIGQREDLDEVKKRFAKKTRHKQVVTIAGGGEVGYHLAESLRRSRFRVTILEADAERCEYLASKLDNVTVLNADSTRRDDLLEARVSKSDAFVATMGHDEDNIVCGAEAKELGAERILAVVRRPDYVNVLGKLGVDTAVSPREVLAREVTGMVVTRPVLSQSSIAGGDAIVYEFEIVEGSPAASKPLKELAPKGALVAAVVEKEFVRVPGPDFELKPGQTAVVLAQCDMLEETVDLFRKKA